MMASYSGIAALPALLLSSVLGNLQQSPVALATVVTAIICYLVGSLNFGVIISRFYGDDIRKHGSGNAGTTNMLRTYGKTAAALTYLGDMTKGVVCVWIGRLIFTYFVAGAYGGYIGAYAALIGHVFPLYFGFKGGKGVATTLGVMLMLDPIVFLIVVLIFVPIVPISGYVSLAAVTGAVGYPVVTLIRQFLAGRVNMIEIGLICVITAMVLYLHRSNIKRLITKTENPVMGKKKTGERKR